MEKESVHSSDRIYARERKCQNSRYSFDYKLKKALQSTTMPVTRKRKLKEQDQFDGLSEYEIMRLKNIAENKRVMASMGLDTVKSEMKSIATRARVAKVRTLGVKKVKRERKKRAPRPPPRRSLRVQGKDADGKSLPDNFREPSQNGGHGGQFSTASEEQELSIQGNVEVDEDGQVFLASLKKQLQQLGKGTPKKRVGNLVAGDGPAPINQDLLKYAERLARLEVDPEKSVRKITKDRIYSLALSPDKSNVVVAAGDKSGRFGLWAVDSSNDVGSDGVFSARPHSATLSDIQFNRTEPNKVFTSSYDGRVMMIDTHTTSGFQEIYNNGGDAGYFEMAFMDNGKGMYLARDDGGLSQLDLRSGTVVNDWQLHEKKINTVNLRPGKEHYISTASLDRSCGVFDSRNMKQALHVLPHALSLNQSTWSPDGAVMTTLCMDNKIRCYDADDLCNNPAKPDHFPRKQTNVCHHDNRTGRWLTKFKVHWDPKQPNAFVIGSMDQPRCIEVFNKSCTRVMRMREDEVVKSVQSLNKFHDTRDVIVSANASGKVHVWR